jgi:uncharacterized membrane protein
MLNRRGSRATWLVLALIGAVFALAISIESTPFLDGRPFRLEMRENGALGTGSSVNLAWLTMGLQIVIALLLLATPFLIVLELLTPEGRRRLLRYAIFLIVLITLLRTVNSSLLQLNAVGLDAAAEAARPRDANDESALPAEVPPPPPPDSVVFAVTAGIALLCALAAIWLFRRNRREIAPDMPMLDFGPSAQNAIDALRDGAGLSETIQRCYFDMCDVVATSQGLNRRTAMTPSEFEHTLAERGLPRGAVHTLTRLFEQTRYGGITADEREKALAIESLEAIAAACKGSQTTRTAGAPA